MAVKEFCNREVVIANKETSITGLAQLMRQYHVGDVVIVESKNGYSEPIGIVTDRDIVMEVIAKGKQVDSITADDIMSRELLVAKEQDGIWTMLQRMRAKGVRRMPIVNEEGGLEGIITADDLLELLSEELSSLCMVHLRGQKREREARA